MERVMESTALSLSPLGAPELQVYLAVHTRMWVCLLMLGLLAGLPYPCRAMEALSSQLWILELKESHNRTGGDTKRQEHI